MAVELIISRNIDNNHVQIDAKRTRTGTHHYSVPKEQTDIFCTSYKNFDKKRNRISDIAFFGSVIIGSITASLLTKNLSNTARTIAMIGSALGLGYIGDYIAKKSFNKKHQTMLANFNAQEIDFKSSPKVADLIK